MERAKRYSGLLQHVPTEELTDRQKAFFPYEFWKYTPVYKVLREPSSFDEVYWKNHHICAIWRENGTFIVHYDDDQMYPIFWNLEHNLFFTNEADFIILGETEAAIAETATLFWSLKQEIDADTVLLIEGCHSHNDYAYVHRSKFDFATLQPVQLAQILNSNPTRAIDIQEGKWTVEQSVVLASRPYPLKLTLGKAFAFKDGGIKFVDVLQTRNSSFGSFCVDFEDQGSPLDNYNLKRLLKLDVFETLDIRCPYKECVLPMFSAKAKTLRCTVDPDDAELEDFKVLNVVTSDVGLKVVLRGDDSQWDEVLVSFLNRVAELGHLERSQSTMIRENIKLLRIYNIDTCHDFDWSVHYKAILGSMEEHKGLRTFVMQNSEYYDDETRMFRVNFDFPLLEQLLSRNRYIELLDRSGKRLSNGLTIDNLYALNRFYRGSTSLVKKAASVRPLLVSSALLNSASNQFQNTALLLSAHIDVLCEWVQEMDLDTADAAGSGTMENVSTLASVPAPLNQTHPKRKSHARASTIAKKPARDQK
ncbi:hypothetical protein FisN_20Hu236 [Fistulifera solaris]|uniref:Uncharacterized protein n=1 Tax=Fistulifera solaris TaxID=1519565 RepID=A0A1Z5JPZ0_FISSO|nr:hypothetical protein FisN_20Hu236 [Fistulifera solaris]|eukprot:GAX16087.1 hypothetical protein FisN_20Hu236 [Fistulifera solaris]